MISGFQTYLQNVPAGGIITIFLVVWIGLETLLIYLSNPEYLMDTFDEGEENIVKQVEQYSSKSLNFASLTFAGLTFIFAQFYPGISNIKDSVFLFVVGFCFFLIAYKLEVYSATYRIIWSTQQRFFNFGLLSL